MVVKSLLLCDFCSYLPVYLWRQANKVAGKDHFTELLKLMSLYQMQEDADFDNAKVNLIVGYFVYHDVFYVVVISAASQR